jgi:hypothetical protein
MQIENPLNEWSWAFPVLGSIHLLGIVCVLGISALMNARLLGLIKDRSPARLWRETWPLALGALALAMTSGLLLSTIAPQEYYASTIFRWKMGALAAAIAFYFGAVRSAARRDQPAAIIAITSLVLYASVPLAGILMGYE